MVVTGDRAGCICIWDAGAAIARVATADAAPADAAPAKAAPAYAATAALDAETSTAMPTLPVMELIAVLPPPDAEDDSGGESGAEDASAIRGLAITETTGAAIAGGGVVYSNAKGELTKFIPLGESTLAGLSDGGLRESLFQSSLLDGLYEGL